MEERRKTTQQNNVKSWDAALKEDGVESYISSRGSLVVGSFQNKETAENLATQVDGAIVVAKQTEAGKIFALEIPSDSITAPAKYVDSNGIIEKIRDAQVTEKNASEIAATNARVFDGKLDVMERSLGMTISRRSDNQSYGDKPFNIKADAERIASALGSSVTVVDGANTEAEKGKFVLLFKQEGALDITQQQQTNASTALKQMNERDKKLATAVNDTMKVGDVMEPLEGGGIHLKEPAKHGNYSDAIIKTLNTVGGNGSAKYPTNGQFDVVVDSTLLQANELKNITVEQQFAIKDGKNLSDGVVKEAEAKAAADKAAAEKAAADKAEAEVKATTVKTALMALDRGTSREDKTLTLSGRDGVINDMELKYGEHDCTPNKNRLNEVLKKVAGLDGDSKTISAEDKAAFENILKGMKDVTAGAKNVLLDAVQPTAVQNAAPRETGGRSGC